jgi:uncharacterized membrane protein YhhN
VTLVRLALAGLAVAAGAAVIVLDRQERRPQVYVGRVVAMLLILAAAVTASHPVTTTYRVLVAAGLVLSLAGDVCMMLPEKKFIEGLAFFLAAHGSYIAAFRPGPGERVSASTMLPFIVLGLLIFRMLAPSLGRLKLPVLIYVAAISAMACLAASRFITDGGTGPLLAMIGALLFMGSDGALAYNRFIRPFPSAQVVILGLYYPAQVLIALSV